jgi:seryl-tRNA synthetase
MSFSSLPFSLPLAAQETPAAAAERQEAEDRYKRMSADIEDLKTSMQSYQQRLTEQREEIKRLRDELAKLENNRDFATKEDLRNLAESVKKVDANRIADNEKLLEKVMAEFARLGRTLAPTPKANSNPSPNPPPPKPSAELKSGGDKGYEYTIRSGDRPGVIAQALAKQGVKVTQKQILDANPAVDWTKLKIGQKIVIPAQAAP